MEVAVETICSFVFLVVPNFLAAFLGLMEADDDDPVDRLFSNKLRFFMVLVGVYPLIDTSLRVRDRERYASKLSALEVGYLRGVYASVCCVHTHDRFKENYTTISNSLTAEVGGLRLWSKMLLMGMQSGAQAVLQLYVVITSFPLYTSSYLSVSPSLTVSELSILLVSITLSIINLGSGFIMLWKLDISRKLLRSLVSSLEFTCKVTTAALLFAMLKQYACVVYAFSWVARVAIIHILRARYFGKKLFAVSLYGGTVTLFLENLLILIEDSSLEPMLSLITTSVMSMLEGFAALMLLYFFPSPAARQLEDWGVSYIITIIITLSFALPKEFVLYLYM